MTLLLKIYHYSEHVIDKLETWNYKVFPQLGIGHKPNGLWVSIEDFEDDQTWESWCIAHDFNINGLKYKYKISLKNDSNFIYLKNDEEILNFTNIYKKVPENPVFDDQSVFHIDWRSLYDLYDGIFIAPYSWSLRLHPITLWYYGWDCASGCIWNTDKIESFELCENEIASTKLVDISND